VDAPGAQIAAAVSQISAPSRNAQSFAVWRGVMGAGPAPEIVIDGRGGILAGASNLPMLGRSFVNEVAARQLTVPILAGIIRSLSRRYCPPGVVLLAWRSGKCGCSGEAASIDNAPAFADVVTNAFFRRRRACRPACRNGGPGVPVVGGAWPMGTNVDDCHHKRGGQILLLPVGGLFFVCFFSPVSFRARQTTA